MKVCPTPSCPTLAKSGYCATCRSTRERRRGTAHARGYDTAHNAARDMWVPLVLAGTVTCRRAPFGLCREDDPLIRPGQLWDLGHPDSECPAPRAPEHQRCNRSTALRRGAPPST